VLAFELQTCNSEIDAMRTFYQDLRFGFRLLLGSPGFTIVAILTLALGIAANTTVFSWVDGVLLHPFGGAADSGRLAVLEMITPGAPNGATQTSYVDYLDYRRNLKSLGGIAVHREDVVTLGDTAAAQPVWGELVSGNYFAVLGLKPVLGRVFRPDEDGDTPGAYPVAVISHRLWQGRFHGDRRAIGKTLRVNQRELTVVGVAPPEFPGTMPGLAFDVWIPVTMGAELGMVSEAALRERGTRALYALVRLQPGVSVAQARAEASVFSHALERANPKTNRGVSATILPLWQIHSGAPQLLSQPLRILMAISVLVLLIGCANVANLLLARSVARRKELSIRLALGAGGARLSRQLLAETLILGGAATLVSLLLASWMAELLPALVPKIGAPVQFGFNLSWRVLAFSILACGVVTLVSGVAPAWFWLRSDPNEALKEGGRGGSAGAHSHRARAILVVSEVALATLAVVGAGLFLRSFQNARAIDPGFDRQNLVLTRFYMAGAAYSPSQLQQFCWRLRDRLQAAPEVAGATYADNAPLGANAGPYTSVRVDGYQPAPDESMNINRYLVAPAYFSTLRIPLIEGREFTEADDAGSPPVAIVNRTFAQRYFGGASPLGRKIRFFGKWATVVGMARDSKYFDIAEAPRPHFYAAYQQYDESAQQLYFFVRAAGNPLPAMSGFRRHAMAVDPNAAAFDVMPMVEWTNITLLPQIVAASLLSALGGISLLLAAVGLYSVMAYSVSQNTREIGIRMALGAQPRDILTGVLRRGVVLTLAGLLSGAAAALLVTRFIGSLLIHVSAADPATFAGAILFLASVALLACYLPARRATHVDPMVALRSE
jgi:predicted permease